MNSNDNNTIAISRNSKYLHNLLNPKEPAVHIPDSTMTQSHVKQLTTSSNINVISLDADPLNSETQNFLIVMNISNVNTVLGEVYQFNNATNRFVYRQTIKLSQDLEPKYTSGRRISGIMTIMQNTVSATNVAISGTATGITTVMSQDEILSEIYPVPGTTTFSELFSLTAGVQSNNADVVVNHSLSDGIVVRHIPVEFNLPLTRMGDSTPVSNVNCTLTANHIYANAQDLEYDMYGQSTAAGLFSTKYNVSIPANSLSVTTVTITSTAALATAVTYIVTTHDINGNTMIVSPGYVMEVGSNTLTFEFQHQSNQSAFAIQVSSNLAATLATRIHARTVVKNAGYIGASRPTTVVALQGVGLGTQITISGHHAYEVVPNTNLMEDITTTYSHYDPHAMNYISMILSRREIFGLRSIMTNYEFKQNIERGMYKSMSDLDSNFADSADWGSILRAIKNIAVPALSTIFPQFSPVIAGVGSVVDSLTSKAASGRALVSAKDEGRPILLEDATRMSLINMISDVCNIGPVEYNADNRATFVLSTQIYYGLASRMPTYVNTCYSTRQSDWPSEHMCDRLLIAWCALLTNASSDIPDDLVHCSKILNTLHPPIVYDATDLNLSCKMVKHSGRFMHQTSQGVSVYDNGELIYSIPEYGRSSRSLSKMIAFMDGKRIKPIAKDTNTACLFNLMASVLGKLTPDGIVIEYDSEWPDDSEAREVLNGLSTLTSTDPYTQMLAMRLHIKRTSYRDGMRTAKAKDELVGYVDHCDEGEGDDYVICTKGHIHKSGTAGSSDFSDIEVIDDNEPFTVQQIINKNYGQTKLAYNYSGIQQQITVGTNTYPYAVLFPTVEPDDKTISLYAVIKGTHLDLLSRSAQEFTGNTLDGKRVFGYYGNVPFSTGVDMTLVRVAGSQYDKLTIEYGPAVSGTSCHAAIMVASKNPTGISQGAVTGGVSRDSQGKLIVLPNPYYRLKNDGMKKIGITLYGNEPNIKTMLTISNVLALLYKAPSTANFELEDGRFKAYEFSRAADTDDLLAEISSALGREEQEPLDKIDALGMLTMATQPTSSEVPTGVKQPGIYDIGEILKRTKKAPSALNNIAYRLKYANEIQELQKELEATPEETIEWAGRTGVLSALAKLVNIDPNGTRTINSLTSLGTARTDATGVSATTAEATLARALKVRDNVVASSGGRITPSIQWIIDNGYRGPNQAQTMAFLNGVTPEPGTKQVLTFETTKMTVPNMVAKESRLDKYKKVVTQYVQKFGQDIVDQVYTYAEEDKSIPLSQDLSMFFKSLARVEGSIDINQMREMYDTFTKQNSQPIPQVLQLQPQPIAKRVEVPVVPKKQTPKLLSTQHALPKTQAISRLNVNRRNAGL